MICTINGQEVLAFSFICRAMNFGQPVLNVLPLQYCASLDTKNFLELVSNHYKQFLHEEMEDNSNEPGEWPTLDRLKEMGYPSLEVLVEKEPTLLEDIIKQWLKMEVLDTLFPFSQDITKHNYSINTLDKITINRKHVVLEGQAYLL